MNHRAQGRQTSKTIVKRQTWTVPSWNNAEQLRQSTGGQNTQAGACCLWDQHWPSQKIMFFLCSLGAPDSVGKTGIHCKAVTCPCPHQPSEKHLFWLRVPSCWAQELLESLPVVLSWKNISPALYLGHPYSVFRTWWGVLSAPRAFTSLVFCSLKWEVLGSGLGRQEKEDSGKATNKGCTQHILGALHTLGPKRTIPLWWLKTPRPHAGPGTPRCFDGPRQYEE